MKTTVIVLGAICLLQAGALFYLWREAARIQQGPGVYRLVQLKPGEAFMLIDSTGTVEASLIDDADRSVDFKIRDGHFLTELQAYTRQPQVHLSYWHMPIAPTFDDGVLMRDRDGDGIPEYKIEKVGGKFRSYKLKSIEWEPKRPNQPPEPTVMSVTPRADARVAPATTVAHL